MEFASATLADIYGFYSASEPSIYLTKSQALRSKFERLEDVIESGPYFGGEAFTVVDAAFAPAFRYFNVFDAIDHRLFDALPKLQKWRTRLQDRPSVRAAAPADYEARLLTFVTRRQSHLAHLLNAHAPALTEVLAP
jgi:glutathione S-transferase